MTTGSRQPNPQRALLVAEVIRKRLKIRRPPIVAVLLANSFGLSIEYVKLNKNTETIVAFLDAENHTIYVNERAPKPLVNFAVARELGHFLMHPEFTPRATYRVARHTDFYRNDDTYIVEATAFATALLANKEWMLDQTMFYCNDTQRLADLFVVPNRVIELNRTTPAFAH